MEQTKMKIAMMSAWNVACGVAMHAEPMGREWVKTGHELKLLAPIEKVTQPVTAVEFGVVFPFVS
jgi:hypothetical protein